MTEFKTWLERKYIDWLAKRGKRGTVREFSEMIGVDQRLMANWMNGDRKPGPEMADKIAIAFGYDTTVHELLGLSIPEKRLLEFKAMYPTMTDDDIADLDKFLDRVRTRHATEQENVSKAGDGHTKRRIVHAS